MTTIKFNIKAQRFVNEKGQFIKESKVLELLDNYRIQKDISINKLSELLTENNPNYDEFLKQTAKELKDIWFVNYVVGKGGVKQLTKNDINILNTELKKELTLSFDSVTGRSYGLQELVTQFEMGEISQEQLNTRLKAYVRGGRRAYWKATDQRTELPFMRRFLNGENHCTECIEYASIGMVPKGNLPLPGERCSCRSNCLCTVKYYSQSQYKQFLKTQVSSFAENVSN